MSKNTKEKKPKNAKIKKILLNKKQFYNNLYIL